MTFQPVYRRGTRSGAQARRLIASQSIASHIIKTTIFDDRIRQPVMRCRAEQTATLAGVAIAPGQHFYLVASKFAHRFYVVTKTAKGWQCSSGEEAVRQRCIRQVSEVDSCGIAAIQYLIVLLQEEIMTTTDNKAQITSVYVPFGGERINLGEEAQAPVPENPLLQYATGLPATRPKMDAEGYTLYDEDTGEELQDHFNYTGFFTPFGVDKDLDLAMKERGGQTLTIQHRGGPAKHWMLNKATIFLLARGIPRGSNSAGELGIVYQWDKGDSTRRSGTVFSMMTMIRPLLPLYTKPFILSVRSTQTGDVLKALSRQYKVIARAHEELQRYNADMPLPLWSYSLTLKASNTLVSRGKGKDIRSIYPMTSVVPDPITAEYLQRQEMPLEYTDLLRRATEKAVEWAKALSARIASGEGHEAIADTSF